MPLGNKENCIELDYWGLPKMALVKSMNRVWKVEWLGREITMKKAIIMEQEQGTIWSEKGKWPSGIYKNYTS